MPPAYVPKPRIGIVGIGDRAVLQRFKDVFTEDPSPSCPIEATPEMLENLSKAVGYPVSLGSRFPIENALAELVSAFSQAIEEVKSPGVGLPVQAITITKNGYTPFYGYAFFPGNADEGRWLTARTDELVLLDPSPVSTKKDFDLCKALQLFD